MADCRFAGCHTLTTATYCEASGRPVNKGMTSGKYLLYKHYPIRYADRDYYQSQDKRFTVTTINWTLATENGKRNDFMVHKNEYEMTLPELFQWIRDTGDAAEDIINIEPIKEAG